MVAMSLLVGLLSAAIAIFALQNNEPMSVRFLGWSLPDIPLAGAILAAFGVGLLLAGIPLSYAQWRWRSRARALEARVELLESALSAREAAVLTPRPAPTVLPPARSA